LAAAAVVEEEKVDRRGLLQKRAGRLASAGRNEEARRGERRRDMTEKRRTSRAGWRAGFIKGEGEV
jgi:hypothetical protein